MDIAEKIIEYVSKRDSRTIAPNHVSPSGNVLACAIGGDVVHCSCEERHAPAMVSTSKTECQMHTVPQIQMFGDVPPRPKFRRFRREENALKFAARMDMDGRLFKASQPVIAHKYDGKTLFFVNYRNRR